ncbi:MAG: TatD family hydrolase [Bacteroidota bacterium]|nr:TatD family hydrolase [Bacteroidota bacterium]
MKLIDTHTHLYLENFNSDIDKVIERAIENNITQFFCPNVDLSTVDKLHDLVKKYPENCFPLMGLHPEAIKENFEKDLGKIEELLSKNKYYGVGEVGIDLYWDKKYKEQQIEAFRFQVKLAKKMDLPVIIHTRDAFDEVFSVIDAENDENLRGIFHCFTGNLKQAQHIIDYSGFKLGIGGVMTYKNSGLSNVVKEVDIKHIVLETDSPFLPPTPKRGKRNESSFLVYIAEFLAQLKQINIQTVAQITTNNAVKVFFRK